MNKLEALDLINDYISKNVDISKNFVNVLGKIENFAKEQGIYEYIDNDFMIDLFDKNEAFKKEVTFWYNINVKSFSNGLKGMEKYGEFISLVFNSWNEICNADIIDESEINTDDIFVDARSYTSNDMDLVKVLLQDIGRIPIYTPEEEYNICLKYKNISDEEIKGKIYRTTAKLIKENGVDNITISDIIDSTNISIETFYANFNDLKDLLKDLKKVDISKIDDEYLENLDKERVSIRNEIVDHNMKLVISIAKRYVGRGVPFTDLIQMGSEGLITAVEKFDATLGNKLSTYAHSWIRQAITRGIADEGRTIRIPVHMHESINRYIRASREYARENGKEPTRKELSEILGVPVEKIEEYEKYSRDPASLDTRIGEDDDSTLGDFVIDTDTQTPEEAYLNKEKREFLLEMINSIIEEESRDEEGHIRQTSTGKLSQREFDILMLRFGFIDGSVHTLQEVGKMYGVTRERIRQIEAKALRKLKNPKVKYKLAGLLEETKPSYSRKL